jgi:hypothetical protein
LADFDARTSGETYEAILAAGGGIRRTIRATSSATKDELVSLAEVRIHALLRSGATTIEVKSGYGLTPALEIAMLEVIEALAAETPARLLPTLLIHIPPINTADVPDISPRSAPSSSLKLQGGSLLRQSTSSLKKKRGKWGKQPWSCKVRSSMTLRQSCTRNSFSESED